MTREHPAGSVFFPATDFHASGATGSDTSGRLRGLPRRRRPAVIALAVAMAGAGVIVSAALYQRADHQVPVVMVTSDVAAGSVITAHDVATTNVTTASGVHVVPAAQLGQVNGEVAAVALRAGTLLAPADLTTSQPPGPGQQLVPVAVKPSVLPASGLSAGDHVLIVATPGDQGEPGSGNGAAAIASPVPAVVAAVNSATDSGGFDVVDLLVKSAAGAAVAEQASTGQFALIVTHRSS